MDNQNTHNYPKPEMLIEVPVFILYPLRVFFQIVGNTIPGVAVSLFKFMFSPTPRIPLAPKEKEFGVHEQVKPGKQFYRPSSL